MWLFCTTALSYPQAYTHTEANRGCQCATVLSLVHHMLGSWQAEVSLLPVNRETGSKANEGPSGTILHAHSTVAGVWWSLSWLTDWLGKIFCMHFLKTVARIYHHVVIALMNDNSVIQPFPTTFIFTEYLIGYSVYCFKVNICKKTSGNKSDWIFQSCSRNKIYK